MDRNGRMTGSGSNGRPAGEAAGQAVPPLPTGVYLTLDPDTSVLRGGRVLLGGEPRRVLRLSAAGARAFDEIRSGPVRTPAGAALGRRLVSVGAAHPAPRRTTSSPTLDQVVVIVPVRDRAAELDRCLRALGGVRVVVVDDGSTDPAAVAVVAARHSARLVHRPVNGGPAAARNSGLAAGDDADVIVFLDSDCVPPPGWLDPLLAHLSDPLVGAVAPRVRPLATTTRTVLNEYTAAHSPLDLGPRAALVRPGTRVAYVPTAALMVRRTALSNPAFDESLRYGEDVDAVWRMVDTGWQVRYEPTVQVAHAEPPDWAAYLRRRFHYGTSAGPLARRHRTRLTPAVLPPWPTAITALFLARKPAAAAAVAALAAARLARTLHAADVPASRAPRMTADSVASTALALARTTAQIGAVPALTAAVGLPGARGRRLVRLGAFLALPAVQDWASRRPRTDPARWTLASLADEIAYGTGVWTGALRSGRLDPLLPRHRGPAGREGGQK